MLKKEQTQSTKHRSPPPSFLLFQTSNDLVFVPTRTGHQPFAPLQKRLCMNTSATHGWWPGQGPLGKPSFYSYTAPAPEGLAAARIRPEKAFYSNEMSEFLFLYDDVRSAAEPDKALMEFLESTYEAGANLLGWPRAELER